MYEDASQDVALLSLKDVFHERVALFLALPADFSDETVSSILGQCWALAEGISRLPARTVKGIAAKVSALDLVL